MESYVFLVDRLKADIRFLFHSLQEFVDPPSCEGAPLTGGAWDRCVTEMMHDLRSLSSKSDELDVDPIMALLNYRDRVMCHLLDGVLFQKAVLDRSLQCPVEGSEGPTIEMAAVVDELASKAGGPPEKYQLPECASVGEPGPFTYDKRRHGDRGFSDIAGGSHEATPLETKMVATLREMQNLDKALRHLRFGEKVVVPDKRSSKGKTVGSDELRREITKWFDKCNRLEHEIQTNKAQRQTSGDVTVQQLKEKCAEKDRLNNQVSNRVHKLESDLQHLKVELANIRKEQGELHEKNMKMMSENIPVLDSIDKEMVSSREAVDRLTADAEQLSSMFRLQVEENDKYKAERDVVSKKLTKAQRELKTERLKGQFKDEELQKKGALYQRTVDARKKAADDYARSKSAIVETESQVRLREEELSKVRAVLDERDVELRRLAEELRQAHLAIDNLEGLKKHCLAGFKEAVGQPYAMLLEQYKDPKKR